MVINFANDFAGDSKSAAGYGAPNNILIENNFLDEAMDHTGGPTYFALNIRECTNCTIRYNSWLQEPRMPNGEISLNNRYIGNLGPMSQELLHERGQLLLQRLEGGKVRQDDRRVRDLGFIRSTPAVSTSTCDETRPRSTTAAEPGTPARHRRPAKAEGSRPDAGADERR